jgi:photoactive yellow protein
MEIIRFGAENIEEALSGMSDRDLDNLAFGAIQLDKDGVVLAYNAMEGEITGRDPQAVRGKNFFTEVAPCTQTPAFFGVFKRGVESGELNTLFDFVFDHEMQPTRVQVHMKRALQSNTYWIFVKRLVVRP